MLLKRFYHSPITEVTFVLTYLIMQGEVMCEGNQNNGLALNVTVCGNSVW